MIIYWGLINMYWIVCVRFESFFKGPSVHFNVRLQGFSRFNDILAQPRPGGIKKRKERIERKFVSLFCFPRVFMNPSFLWELKKKLNIYTYIYIYAYDRWFLWLCLLFYNWHWPLRDLYMTWQLNPIRDVKFCLLKLYAQYLNGSFTVIFYQREHVVAPHTSTTFRT